MKIVGILLCAGGSTRMGFHKLTTPIGGKTPIEYAAQALVAGGCTELVLVTSKETLPIAEQLECMVQKRTISGGATRTESVRNGLLAASGEIAVIHDAARCFCPPEVVRSCIESAVRYGSGVAALSVTDTVMRRSDTALVPIDRDSLVRMQTPQAFRYEQILHAYRIDTDGGTDDATLYQRHIGLPRFVMGSELSRKLTTPQDWAWATERMGCTKYGTGFDTHRLVEGRRLILGGVDIPYDRGLLGHSDADVLLHAIMDAILGACALGDIGKCFPDTDAAYHNIDSRLLLRRVADLVQKGDMEVCHVDATVICQRPKLAPHMDAMRANIASDLGLPLSAVSVKATTTEGMNDEGRGLCISAQAVASVRPKLLPF